MKKRIFSIIAVAVLLCTLVASVSAAQIKNVIFMIPDGAGMNTFDLANDVKVAGGFDDTKFPNKTEVDSSPLLLKSYMAGTCITDNYMNQLTDSAAAGTALSTGVKTLGGYLCVDYRGRPKANVLEAAQSVGMSTGIVATYEWMHATPAAYGAHVTDRTDYKSIYEQMENQGIDVVLGSGYGAVSEYATIQNAVDRGYTIVSNRADLEKVRPGDRLWGNATNPSSPYDINLGADEPTLEQMTRAAITALSGNEKGFFLMVEGSKVDTGGHANDALATSSEYIAFDAAFAAAVEFAKGRNDTIVIATPDHDTGGMLYHDLLSQNPEAASAAVATIQNGADPSSISWTTGSHTQELVGVWAYIPEGVDTIKGLNPNVGDNEANRNDHVIDNTAFAPYIANLLGVDLDSLTDELFVDVTDIGTFDVETNKFTFNRGNKYVYRNQDKYYKDGTEISLDGKVAVLSAGKMYVPADMVEEADWDYVNSDSIQGTGTQDDPYLIDNAKNFLEFTNAVIGGEKYDGKYFLQRNDIDMSGIEGYTGMTGSHTFNGVYNGDGYNINVNISRAGEVGVFGVVNGTVVNVTVTGTLTSTDGMAASIARKVYGKLVNSVSFATLSGASGSASGLAMSVYGTIENCYFGGTIINGAKNPVAAVNGTAKNCYYVDTCGATQTTTGVTSVTQENVKSTFAATLNDGRNSAASSAGLDENDICYWRHNATTSLPELYVPVPYVTSVTVSPEVATVNKGETLKLTANVEGEYNPSTKVLWSIEATEDISDGTTIDENGLLTVDRFETASGFTVMAKSAVNGAVAGTAHITIGKALVISEDETIIAGDNALVVDAVSVNSGVTLTLGRGSYVFGEIQGEGSLVVSPNANIIVTGENKPEGYVEINLGDKQKSTNVRYAEVFGEQYTIRENNNLYGVIANEDMLVEITEKASKEAVVAESVRYFFVDVSEGTYTELSMNTFINNVNDLSIRVADPIGLRFKVKVNNDAKRESEEFEIVEYGFVIGLESRLINLGEQLNFNATNIVHGIAYNAEDGTDIVFDSSDDNWAVVTGVLINIPESCYDETVVSKTYTRIKIGESVYTVYGEPVVANTYEIAFISKGLDMTVEHKTVIDDIISKAEDMSPDLGFDVGVLYN
ncbi:MAG: alkaline phosphatase [Clostridia bacterium]|nr:alkaline phosphatase [Clostridia bacterium]